jgi:hypothetical protein
MFISIVHKTVRWQLEGGIRKFENKLAVSLCIHTSKVKGNFSLRVIKHCAMKTYGGV